MVFNATFKNTSDISWRSDLLVEETGVPGVKTQNASYNIHVCMFILIQIKYQMYFNNLSKYEHEKINLKLK
jgi:hypothetical protein